MSALFAFDAHDRNLTADRHKAIAAWLRTVGVDPARVRSGTVRATTAGYQLELVEYVPTEEGKGWQADLADPTRLLTRRNVVQLGPVADWPGAEAERGGHPGDAAPGG